MRHHIDRIGNGTDERHFKRIIVDGANTYGTLGRFSFVVFFCTLDNQCRHIAVDGSRFRRHIIEPRIDKGFRRNRRTVAPRRFAQMKRYDRIVRTALPTFRNARNGFACFNVVADKSFEQRQKNAVLGHAFNLRRIDRLRFGTVADSKLGT